jgi:uncharacterized protein (DUF427 family)
MDTAQEAPKKAPGFIKNPGRLLEVEPCPRRLRIKFNGETVLDTTAALLMREGGHVPVYYAPMEDVRMDLFTATDNDSYCPYKGHASYWSLTVGDRRGENVMWSYRDPYEEMLAVKDYVAFYWGRMESWWEEDEEIFSHARDPKHRVDAILSYRPVRVVVGGEVVAETTSAHFVFETGHPVRYYIPPDDVRMDLLSDSQTSSRCPYKGVAQYHDASIGGETHSDIAWSYSDPIEECPKIKGLISFFNENVDAILVDGVEVEVPVTKWSRKK